ncbi:hypothetical protein N9963_01955 [Crocinitomicaceae bacterium]|nr:hypothetical protein [Crocinitomicaceae bacterium]
MKKIFIALSLMMFVGTVGTTVYAASNDVQTEISKDDDKKKKRKKKNKKNKKCSTENKACSTKSAEKSCCSKKK